MMQSFPETVTADQSRDEGLPEQLSSLDVPDSQVGRTQEEVLHPTRVASGDNGEQRRQPERGAEEVAQPTEGIIRDLVLFIAFVQFIFCVVLLGYMARIALCAF